MLFTGDRLRDRLFDDLRFLTGVKDLHLPGSFCFISLLNNLTVLTLILHTENHDQAVLDHHQSYKMNVSENICLQLECQHLFYFYRLQKFKLFLFHETEIFRWLLQPVMHKNENLGYYYHLCSVSYQYQL